MIALDQAEGEVPFIRRDVLAKAFGDPAAVTAFEAINRAVAKTQSDLQDASFNDLSCDTLRINQAPTATSTASTHSIPVNINGVTMYLRLSATP